MAIRLLRGVLNGLKWALCAVGAGALILAAMIATPLQRPPEMRSVSDSARGIDWSTLPAMERFQARDGTCRFPDCHRPASRADLDHIQPWRDDQPPEGQTIPANLQALCREHHRAKHQLHWTPQMHPDGTITWHNNLLAITVET